MNKNIIIKTETDLKKVLADQYINQINNFFGDEKKALRFLSSVMSSVQRTPKLLECTGASLINSFMRMAEMALMPSDVSGEAYVIPYKGEAQFQMGYQGFITLFYRAGGMRIRAEIVREHDEFQYINGEVKHTVDLFKSKEMRGKAIGAYAIGDYNNSELAAAMNADDILAHGKKFSKSFDTKFTPWNEDNDPELWMWKKTVIKQLMKLLPKNETINKAMSYDNEDSVVQERMEQARKESESLTMGSLVALPKPTEEPQPVIEQEVEEENPRKKAAMEAMEKAKTSAAESNSAADMGSVVCTNCHGKISEKEIEFSQKRYKKTLCFECQKTE